ncbi:MAG: hypothetical protein ABI675_23585 [Chitinophagaceae bacterium]
MKKSRFTGLLFSAAMVFFLTSCGGDDSKEKSSTDSATGDTTTAVPEIKPEVVNTIVTAPENMVIVTHKVADFAKWKLSYDAHDSIRLAAGVHSYVLGRGVQDSNMVMVVLKADDIAKAKAFAKDPSLKKAMQKGGVTGAPTISFMTAVWQDTAHIGAVPRSMTRFMVKDWDAWQKSFEEGKQERIDNGLTVRVVSHDVDDNKSVSLVTAIMDTAKASAYWKSDMLKKRRAAGGVIGEPKRFVFNVAYRY